MIDVTTIPMAQFALKWRFTDPKYHVLPAGDLEQIKPLDNGSAKWLSDLTGGWHREHPFVRGLFAHTTSMSLDYENAKERRQVRTWLLHRGLPLNQPVFVSWDQTWAAVTNWKMVAKYWDDLWYPGSDDLDVFDESLSWALFFWHEEEAFFASNPEAGLPRE